MLLERVCDGDRSDARQKRAVDLRKSQLDAARGRPQRGSLFFAFGQAQLGNSAEPAARSSE
jgi:hypothetical protein